MAVTDAVIDFVGAGPGDPELLTLKARRLIAEADVILYAGSLVNPAVLEHARRDAVCLNTADMKLEAQIAHMRQAIEEGRRVVRLHTGDPAIFGAIHEQLQAVQSLGLPYRLTPGVSSAFAAASALGIEYTVPGLTQTVIFTRMPGRTPVPEREHLRHLSTHGASLVIFLSAGLIDEVVEALRQGGYAPDTPIAVVQRASWPDQRIVRGTLADIGARCLAAEVTHQALIVVSPALAQSSSGTPPSQLRSHLYGAAQESPTRQPTIGIVTLTRRGAQVGLRLSAALADTVLYTPARFAPPEGEIAPTERRVPYNESVRQTLHSAFQTHTALICVMASGIVVRELGPLLSNKRDDPGVVVVDEQGHFAISLIGGHLGGANELARRVAECLGGQAVITTASDGQALPALDLLGRQHGWRSGDGSAMTAVIGAMVNGEPIGLLQDAGDESWQPRPLPSGWVRLADMRALTESAPPVSAALIITHRQPRLPANMPAVIYHPPCLTIGVGCNRNTPADEICAAVTHTLNEAGLSPLSVSCVGTIEQKAKEPGLIEACRRLGWPLRVFSTSEISQVTDLPNPSAHAQHALGVPGVAEPAALLAAGVDRSETDKQTKVKLIVEKRRFPNVTVAVAMREHQHPSKSNATGKLSVVGIGPGGLEHLTPAARAALEQADVILGYKRYLDLIQGVAPGVPREASGMRSEVARAQRAIALAQAGRRVALVSGGDAGVYGMAGPVFEVLRAQASPSPDVPVEIVPGISALNAAAAALGAPLMTDFAVISLSDHLVPLEQILNRLEAMAQADLVICLYNPRSHSRTQPFEAACRVLLRHRSPDTPVGIVRAACREGQQVAVIRLADLPATEVDMLTTIVVGNSATFTHAGRMVTPRGYDTKYDLEEL
ncbi:MAG: precorrin-4 C(11)-methyltransferase [Anaerolineae bacterium]